VVAHAAVRATAEELPALRRSPGTLGGVVPPASLLRHADEQTVVGLAAVLRAVESGGLDPGAFGGWAVIAAPRLLGRPTFEAVFPQFLAEGAWGVSPHLIPNHSLHAPSGVISQVLKAHGPNLGLGGAPGRDAEALLAAAAFLEGGSVPGAWVVLTGWRDERSEDEAPPSCEAMALALTASRPGWRGVRLQVGPASVRVNAPKAGTDRAAAEVVARVMALGVGSKSWRLDSGDHTPTPGPHPRRAAGRDSTVPTEAGRGR
jgi:hypothetical protein